MSLILSGTDGLSDVDGSAATPAIRGTDANTGIFFPAADTIAFSEGGVESMRIDSSGNVQIGTTSGSDKLTVLGAIAARRNAGGYVLRFLNSSSSDEMSGFIYDNNQDNIEFTAYDSSYALTFKTNNTERMRISSAGTITFTQTTLASYLWNAWNPTNLTGTVTNAPNTGTADDSDYVTMSNSSGTLTVTFDIAGKYFICITQQTAHTNVYTNDRVTTNLGGTATRRISQTPMNSGDSANDNNFSISTGFYVSATASQTLTLLPTFELSAGSGTTAQHTAYCSVTIQYCGG